MCKDINNKFSVLCIRTEIRMMTMYDNSGNNKKSGTGNLFSFLNHHIQAISTSKLFAGLMIIAVNISSKFVTVKLSKSVETYLKYTFSRNILIFCMSFMGSRDIYIALLITFIFIICMDYLFHEESMFCILPSSFLDHHKKVQENMENKNEPPTQQQIADAIKTLHRLESHLSTNDAPGNLMNPFFGKV